MTSKAPAIKAIAFVPDAASISGTVAKQLAASPTAINAIPEAFMIVLLNIFTSKGRTLQTINRVWAWHARLSMKKNRQIYQTRGI
jgi:hypothetical protein